MSTTKEIRKLADASAKLYNEVNYERRQQFFQQRREDLKCTWDKYCEKYKEVLGVNAQAVLQKNNEAWSSLFSSLKNKDRLRQFVKHVAPPGYWKDKRGKRKLIS
ncbi:hypothetical protein GWK48_11250 [Metallosphaera tengchongensis]|uniref:Transposase n=1 Tax=Metallosphaera tengchongensis TaxID=1532350 RepID=A0A6N0NVW2_9CREN|nr:hypothetical protein [Metallosphaera tengchongensis]QKR00882.1 hypothetical protein GWK48_11250 [Metallosphaera tengchongensis]